MTPNVIERLRGQIDPFVKAALAMEKKREWVRITQPLHAALAAVAQEMAAKDAEIARLKEDAERLRRIVTDPRAAIDAARAAEPPP